MKNHIKNIAAVIMISGLFFVPVFCSAQVSGGGDNIDPSTTIINPPVNDNSVEEEEQEAEELLQQNIDLQNMLQKQQQYIQIMSNLSKIIHDTQMAVRRKIG